MDNIFEKQDIKIIIISNNNSITLYLHKSVLLRSSYFKTRLFTQIENVTDSLNITCKKINIVVDVFRTLYNLPTISINTDIDVYEYIETCNEYDIDYNNDVFKYVDWNNSIYWNNIIGLPNFKKTEFTDILISQYFCNRVYVFVTIDDNYCLLNLTNNKINITSKKNGQVHYYNGYVYNELNRTNIISKKSTKLYFGQSEITHYFYFANKVVLYENCKANFYDLDKIGDNGFSNITCDKLDILKNFIIYSDNNRIVCCHDNYYIIYYNNKKLFKVGINNSNVWKKKLNSIFSAYIYNMNGVLIINKNNNKIKLYLRDNKKIKKVLLENNADVNIFYRIDAESIGLTRSNSNDVSFIIKINKLYEIIVFRIVYNRLTSFSINGIGNCLNKPQIFYSNNGDNFIIFVNNIIYVCDCKNDYKIIECHNVKVDILLAVCW